jgi:putative oxidoreductase
MERGRTRALIGTGLCLLLAAMWVYAAVPKLADPGKLFAAIHTYRMLPHPVAAWLAVWLPWVELGVALTLIVPRWRQGGLLLTIGLMGMFVVALGQAWARGLDVTCGCFGGPATSGPADFAILIGRDLLLAAAASVAGRLCTPEGDVRTNPVGG